MTKIHAILKPNVLTPGPSGTAGESKPRDYWLRPLELQLHGIEDKLSDLRIQLIELDTPYGEGTKNQVLGEFKGVKNGLGFTAEPVSQADRQDLVGIDLMFGKALRGTAVFPADKAEGLRAELQLKVFQGSTALYTSPAPALVHLGPALPLLHDIGNNALWVRDALNALEAVARDVRSILKNLRNVTMPNGILARATRICAALAALRRPLVVIGVALAVLSGGSLAAVTGKMLRILAKILKAADKIRDKLEPLRKRARAVDPKLKRAEKKLKAAIELVENLETKVNKIERGTLLVAGDVKALNCLSRRRPVVEALFQLRAGSASLPTLSAGVRSVARSAAAITGPARRASAHTSTILGHIKSAEEALGSIKTQAKTLSDLIPDFIEELIDLVGDGVEVVISKLEWFVGMIPFVGWLYKKVSQALAAGMKKLLGFLGTVSADLSAAVALIEPLVEALGDVEEKVEKVLAGVAGEAEKLAQAARQPLEEARTKLEELFGDQQGCLLHLAAARKKLETEVDRKGHWKAKVQSQFKNEKTKDGRRVVLGLTGIPETDGTAIKVELWDCNDLNAAREARGSGELLKDDKGQSYWDKTVSGGRVQISNLSNDHYVGDIVEKVQELFPVVKVQEPGSSEWTTIWRASHYQPVRMEAGKLVEVVSEDFED